MINSRGETFRIQLLQLCDAVLIWIAFWFGWTIRNFLRLDTDQLIGDAFFDESINWILYIAVPLTPLMLEFTGFYKNLRIKKTGGQSSSSHKVCSLC